MVKKALEMSQEELTNKTIRRIYNRGKRKGYVSPEYIEKTIKNKNIPREKVEEILEVFKNEEIKVIDEAQAALMPVVKKKRGRKKGSTNKKTSKSLATGSDDLEEGEDILGKTDDPVRMYLREMGGVELLSREGEIAIAKRIEAGKDVMLNALSQSPLTAQQFFDWNTKLQNDEIMVREIIDIDTNYMEDEDTGQSAKQKKTDDATEETSSDDDEFNPTLAAMETEIKPKVLKTIHDLTKEYNKLIKYQKEKLECLIGSKQFSSSKEKN